MKKEQAAKEYSDGTDHYTAVIKEYGFLAGCEWQAKQDEERIKSLEEKLKIVDNALELTLIHGELARKTISKIRGEEK